MELRAYHKQAIELLASGSRIEETSQSVGVTRRSVYNWLDDPTFAKALQKRQSEYIRRLNIKLITANEKALEVLLEGLESREENIKVRCASILIGKYHQTIELEDILQRLDELERDK